MKRSTFRPKWSPPVKIAPEDRQPVKIAALLRAKIEPVTSHSQPVKKFEYYRSRKLLDAVKTLPCQHCGASAPSDPAHSNQSQHGKAKGRKASDQYIAAICRADHHEIDQGSKLSKAERLAMWDAAHIKTVRELLRRGLWPEDAPLPDIRRFDA